MSKKNQFFDNALPGDAEKIPQFIVILVIYITAWIFHNYYYSN